MKKGDRGCIAINLWNSAMSSGDVICSDFAEREIMMGRLAATDDFCGAEADDGGGARTCGGDTGFSMAMTIP